MTMKAVDNSKYASNLKMIEYKIYEAFNQNELLSFYTIVSNEISPLTDKISKLDYRCCFVEVVGSEYIKYSVIFNDCDLYITKYFNTDKYGLDDCDVIFTFLMDGDHILTNVIEIDNIGDFFMSQLKKFAKHK